MGDRGGLTDENRDGKIEAVEVEQFAQRHWEDEGTGIIRVRTWMAGKTKTGKLLIILSNPFCPAEC